MDFKNIVNFQISLSIKTDFFDFFMERYNKLIDKLTFSFRFIDCLYFKYRLEALKNEFFTANVLRHSLFCSRSSVS